jgi:hypothetical protein
MAGKFLDDIDDVSEDNESRSPNLIQALATEHESDRITLASALSARHHLTLYWWARHCPRTFESYFQQVFKYYGQISDRTLRLPVDIYLLILLSRIRRRPSKDSE